MNAPLSGKPQTPQCENPTKTTRKSLRICEKTTLLFRKNKGKQCGKSLENVVHLTKTTER